MSHPYFRVLEEIRDYEGNVYCPGLLYTADRDRLIRKAEALVMNGKAEWVAPGNPGKAGGRGVVK